MCVDPGYLVESIGIINTVKSSQLQPLPQRIVKPQDSFLIIDSSFSIKNAIEGGRSFRLMSFRRANNGDDLFLSAAGRGHQLNLQRKDQNQNNAQIWTYDNVAQDFVNVKYKLPFMTPAYIPGSALKLSNPSRILEITGQRFTFQNQMLTQLESNLSLSVFKSESHGAFFIISAVPNPDDID